ncbi:MAG: AMP-binding protein [Pirellulales bacterium]|nr:AMP-binding protein [Pirellulales bacterium]
MTLPGTMIRRCRQALFRWKVADVTTPRLTGGNLLMRTLILRRLLLREIISEETPYVGVLLPPSVGGLIINAAITMAKQTVVNLNYTLDNSTLNACIRRTGLKYVLTSRKVFEKLNYQLNAHIVYLEDLREQLSLRDKLAAFVGAYLTPARMLERQLGVDQIDPEDVMTVIFTSGSTGMPKGVRLTYRNIESNVVAIEQVVHLRRNDTLLGILPFFHSFGYTLTLWAVLGHDIRGVFHFTPLDARTIGKLCRNHGVNILFATATFLRSYLKRCSKEDFHRLEIVVTGAEKLPIPLIDAFEKKFGLRPVEGYGTTELSPLVSVNTPPTRSTGTEVDLKEGTIGRTVPQVQAKIVHPETFKPLPVGEEGMLMVSGPNVMKDYLDEPEKTAEAIRDGWYVTGDIAKIDGDGFITITGRVSRFSKIGGEMVPHVRIEEALYNIIGQKEDEPVRAVVAAVADERKGERLIVVHTALDQTPDEICQALAAAGLSNLWIPSPDSFVHVDSLPILGTGKLDLRGVAEIARQRLADKT